MPRKITTAKQRRVGRVGQQLDALGPAYRLSATKQARIEELLALKNERRLTSAERRELTRLLRAANVIMLRRAAALHKLQ